MGSSLLLTHPEKTKLCTDISRPLRAQFPVAWYHVIYRGKRGEKELIEGFSVNIAAYCLLSKETLKR